jgi:hypothetical protein
MTKNVVRVALAIACAAVCTAACSGRDPATGTLHGHLLGVGGPAPGTGRPWTGTITLTGQGLHRDVVVGHGGAFSVPLPAGNYQLAGRSPSCESGAGQCRATGLVTVRAGRSVTADVLCQMR